MKTLYQDFRYGLRALRKNPGFTLVAVLTFALGIGANAAMFSVVKSVLLASLPFPDADRVMVAAQKMANGQPNLFSTPDFLEWKHQSGAFPQLAAFTFTNFTLGGSEATERIAGGRISYDLFPILGVQPILGRGFTADEDRPGGTPVAIISHALWTTRFHRNPGAIGQSLTLDGTKYTIIGAMPTGFSVFSNTELLWTPLRLPAEATGASPNVHWLWGGVRLASRMSQAQTQAALDAVAARLHRDNASDDAGFGVVLTPVRDSIVGNVRPALLLLMGCVTFVLLIACANVANLLLARGTGRRRELSIRAALGARRSRVVRQLVTESVLLATLGGIVGVALAFIAIKLLFALHPSSIPLIQPATIDAPVLGYALLLCLASGILFGLVPAWSASRVNVSDALKEGSTGAGSGMGKQRVILAVVETALALMLLIGSGLALKSLWLLGRVDPGFDASNILTFRISAPARLAPERLPDFYREVVERIRALPGAKSVTLARDLPMSGVDPSMPITVPGHALALADTPSVTRFRAIGPDYFHALGTPVLRGREFTDGDSAAAPGVVIVSQSLAKLYWPGQDPVGKSLTPQAPGAHPYTVIGVVADVRHWSLDVDIEPTAYYSYTQVPGSLIPQVEKSMSIVVRTAGSGADILPAIRSAVAGVSKDAPIFGVRTMSEMLADSGSLRRFDLLLLGSFAALALVLATVGIYGVIAYWVSQRTREIGIRMALGAQRRDVLELVVRRGVQIGIIGIVFGVAGALTLSRLMSTLLYGVSPTDPLTFALVAAGVALVVLGACLVPARRATRVDPIVALRYE